MSEQRMPSLSMKNITKRFGEVVANHNVNLDIYPGEVLAILGENGCGKTTLMNMVSGIYFPDEGQVFVGGKEVHIRCPKDAYDLRIGMIHQHFKLVDIFTAAENIDLGIKNSSLKDVNKRVREIADKYGFHIDPEKKIYEMSVSEKQTVEIIKVLYRGADILILDEPTAVLTLQEIRRLFHVLRSMVEDGKSVIIITHKLNEVLQVSDRVAIMRKGEHVATVNTCDANEQMLTEMMVGKKISLNIERDLPQGTQKRLQIRNLNAVDPEGLPLLKDVSFDLMGGEILGIAGIAGSGQRELLEAVAGLQPLTSGEIIFNSPKKNKPVTFFHKSYKKVFRMIAAGAFHYEDGTPVTITSMRPKKNLDLIRQVKEGKVLFNEDEVMNLRDRTPLEIRRLGVHLSFVPEDRLGMGLVGNMNLADNMLLRSYRKGFGDVLMRRKPTELAEQVVRELEVVTPSIRTSVRQLSGGNVQKVLVGREIASSPYVLMAAYPVRGLDINSSYTIYNLLNDQKKKGAAVIFVGEDLDVLMALCDRIVVMNAGRVVGIADARTVEKEELGAMMTRTYEKEEAKA